MELQAILNCSLIAAGAAIMGVSIFRSFEYRKKTPAIRPEERNRISLSLSIHRALMAFFLLGYAASIVAILLDFPLLSETFVSFIFLFGAVFVYLGVGLHLQLLAEIERLNKGD